MHKLRRWAISGEKLVGVVSTIVTLSVLFVSCLGNPTHLVRLPLVLPIPLVLSVLVFSLLIPWARRESGTAQSSRSAKVGLACSILGLLTVAGYGSGFPIILGVGGAVLGREGGGGLARAAYIIGIVAVILALIAFVAGRVVCVLGGPC
jgi:hypothetical protein